jgi:hypothetical protein
LPPGFVRGFSGFGGPLVMLTALKFLLAPTVSIPIILCVDAFRLQLLSQPLEQKRNVIREMRT